MAKLDFDKDKFEIDIDTGILKKKGWKVVENFNAEALGQATVAQAIAEAKKAKGKDKLEVEKV